jgi:hypothetical protein
MIEILDDIEKSLKAEVYRPALALALTLPDICGKIEFSELTQNGSTKQHYVKWYDENLTKYDYPEEFEERLKFDGEKCYRLRCAYLHSGNIDGVSIDEFDLQVTKPKLWGVYGPSEFGTFWRGGDEKNKKYSMSLDVIQLCLNLSSCARGLYERTEDKAVFRKYSIHIRDMNAEYEKIQKFMS